jgi:hypothetical protein
MHLLWRKASWPGPQPAGSSPCLNVSAKTVYMLLPHEILLHGNQLFWQYQSTFYAKRKDEWPPDTLGPKAGSSTCLNVHIISKKQCCGSMTFWGWIQIRIRGSMPLTKGSGSCYFRHRPSRCQQKTNFLTKFFLLITF